MSSREQCPWHKLELKMHRRVDGKWQSLIEFADEMEEEFYSLDGELDAAVKKKWNSKLVVCGPSIHDYISELGNGMLNRLQKGKIRVPTLLWCHGQ